MSTPALDLGIGLVFVTVVYLHTLAILFHLLGNITSIHLLFDLLDLIHSSDVTVQTNNQSINQSVLFQAAWPIERETAKQT